MESGLHRRELGPSERTRRTQRVLALLALVGVGLATAAGAAAAWRDERHATERVADGLVEQAAMTTRAVVERTADRLLGAGALVESTGDIDRDGFEVYGAAVLADSASAVALGVVVAGEDRAGFERAELPIVVRQDDGSFGPAPRADEHYPIVDVVAEDPGTSRALGLDYAVDPARAAAVRAARDSGVAAVTAPIRLAASAQQGIITIQPLYRPGAPIGTVEARRRAFVGFVTQSYRAVDVLAEVETDVPAAAVIRVRDGEDVLFGAVEIEGEFVRSTEVAVAGRTWDVSVRPVERPSATLPRFIVGAGVVVELGLLALITASWRYQRRLRLANASQQQAQRRSETLEGLAARLSRSLSSEEVGHALLDQLPPFTGTTAGAVLLLDDTGAALRLVAADGYREEQVAAFAVVDLGVRSALADAVRSGEPAWLPSPLAWRDDDVTGAFGTVGRALAIVPLVADRVVGVLVLVHPGVRSFYDDERSLLQTVAALAARALTRARRYDTEHLAASVLQLALLPTELPTVAGVAAAVRYLPATDGLAVGGDWYDLFTLPDGRLAVVVGDVVGRGVRAAAAMGRLRSALRALADVVPDPVRLLAAFESHIETVPDALCATLVYAVLDPAAGRLEYVRAGHVPPILVDPSGVATVLDGGVATPLGVTGGEPPRTGSLAFEPGSTLVLVTDGVIERRDEPVTVGLERLRVAAAGAAADEPERCCDRIVSALLGSAGHGDDAAVVVVRLEAVAVAGRVVDAARSASTSSR